MLSCSGLSPAAVFPNYLRGKRGGCPRDSVCAGCPLPTSDGTSRVTAELCTSQSCYWKNMERAPVNMRQGNVLPLCCILDCHLFRALCRYGRKCILQHRVSLSTVKLANKYFLSDDTWILEKHTCMMQFTVRTHGHITMV